jgi:hypothetical protein
MQARWFHIIEEKEKRRKKKSSPVAAAGGAEGNNGAGAGGAQHQQPQEKKKRMRRVDVKLLAEAATKSARGDDLFEQDAPHPHQHGGAGNGTARRGPVAALDDLADLASPAAVGVAGPGSARPRKRSKVSAAHDADGEEDGDGDDGAGAASPPVRVTRSNAGNGKSPARGAAAKPSAADSWKATYVHNLKKKMQAAPNGKGKGEAGKAKGATARALEVATAGPKGRVNGLATAVQVGGVVAGLVGGKVKVAATGRGAASSSHSPGTRKRLGLLHVDVEDGDDEDENGAEEDDGYADDMADDEEGDYN